MIQVGVTEGGDASFDLRWQSWVENGNPTILITKNIKKLYEINPKLFIDPENKYKNVIMHATITGLGGTIFEPNVPKSNELLDFIIGLLGNKDFHKERIVIREDPIIPAFVIKDSIYQQNLISIAQFAKKYGFRYRTSFFDYYPHVRTIFNNIKVTHPETSEMIEYLNRIQPELHLSLDLRMVFLDNFMNTSGLKDTDIEICGEPGMKCTGCISKKDLDIFEITLDSDVPTGLQRPACACLGIKKELIPAKHPCGHMCSYCYWKK